MTLEEDSHLTRLEFLRKQEAAAKQIWLGWQRLITKETIIQAGAVYGCKETKQNRVTEEDS